MHIAIDIGKLKPTGRGKRISLVKRFGGGALPLQSVRQNSVEQ
jgi:hypothetical protein